MAAIKNIEGLSNADINRELSQGAKFVVFEYSISILVMSFKRSSDIYFKKAGEPMFGQRFGYSLISLIFGWWGIPWGPIYTIWSLVTNLSGGKDLTKEVLASLNQPEPVVSAK
jgi:hypothetical protein